MHSVVMTRQGNVAGERHPGLEVFRGIPYAAPPVGMRRFRPPEPHPEWQGTRDALALGFAAPQPRNPLFGDAEQSEDCLTLNVWTPGADTKRRPVLVWIHGGGFTAGSSAQEVYDGSHLARRGDVVVVTLNYRLGALGFLYVEGLEGVAEGEGSNLGLRDQVAALEWVRDNIEAFGGDPERVTIFGESAGGMSVGALLAAPAAQGLFHRAIAQSGAVHHVVPREEAARMTEVFLEAAGLTSARAAELWELPVEAVLRAQAECMRGTVLRGPEGRRLPQQGMVLIPVADGQWLPREPLAAIRAGQGSRVPLLIGTNTDEWHFFIFLTDPKKRGFDEATLTKICDRRSLGHGERLVCSYREHLPGGAALEPWQIFSAIETDRMFRVPALRLAEAHAAAGLETYSYLFDWRSPLFDSQMGSCHFLEVPFVFDTVSSPIGRFFAGDAPEAEQLSQVMVDAWLGFARDGSPKTPALDGWGQYDEARRVTALLQLDPTVVEAPGDALRAAWDGLM